MSANGFNDIVTFIIPVTVFKVFVTLTRVLNHPATVLIILNVTNVAASPLATGMSQSILSLHHFIDAERPLNAVVTTPVTFSEISSRVPSLCHAVS